MQIHKTRVQKAIEIWIPKSIRRTLNLRWCDDGFVSKFASVQKLVDFLWLRKSGSQGSIITYSWALSDLCSRTHCSPDEIVLKSREELELIVQKYVDEKRSDSKKRGPSTRFPNTILACLKTFFRLNGFNRENNQELRLQSYHQPPRTRNRPQYVPAISEVSRMAERAGNTRNRAIILTLASTGLRNTALRAMLVKDIVKEIEKGQRNLLIKVEPEWNKRITGACKGGIPYYTFTSAQATQAIKETLVRRKEVWGFIEEEEPLFISGSSQLNKKKHLSNRQLDEVVEIAAREAEVEEWDHVTPHSLRKVFESVLRSPMNDGDRMDHKDQEFLMGHILLGVQDAYYDWTKINNLRSQFAKLSFDDKKTPELENLKIHRQIAQLLGIDADIVKVKRETELGRTLRVKEEVEVLETAIKARLTPRQDEKEQKIICKDELQACLNDGWKFVNMIDEKSVVVERFVSNSIGDNLPLSSLLVKK